MMIGCKCRYLVLFALVVLGFASCKKTTNQILRDEEKVLLAKYISKYHSGIKPTSSGLYIVETKPGTGDSIKAGNYVKVFYRGYLIQNNDSLGIIDGYNFDASGNYEPFGFTAGSSSVISGWDEAITHMKEGGEAKWIIPSGLAYSSSGSGSIPAYSPLVFYVTVYKVYRSTDVYPTIQKTYNSPLINR